MTYRYLPSFGLRVLQIVILIESLFRGVSYLTVPKAGTIILTDIEQSAPMQVWGIAFISFAVLGIYGEALMSGTNANPYTGGNPRAWPSFVAHSGLMILYGTMVLAYADASFNGRPVLAQAAAAMAVFAYVHWLFARRRKTHAT
jgi:hypothetical protein